MFPTFKHIQIGKNNYILGWDLRKTLGQTTFEYPINKVSNLIDVFLFIVYTKSQLLLHCSKL